MSGTVVSITGGQPAGRYYGLTRYVYAFMEYVSVRELCRILFGVSLISAAPFFYLLITHDILPCVVFMANAAVGVVIGVRNFMKKPDRALPQAPAVDAPHTPVLAHHGLKAA